MRSRRGKREILQHKCYGVKAGRLGHVSSAVVLGPALPPLLAMDPQLQRKHVMHSTSYVLQCSIHCSPRRFGSIWCLMRWRASRLA